MHTKIVFCLDLPSRNTHYLNLKRMHYSMIYVEKYFACSVLGTNKN